MGFKIAGGLLKMFGWSVKISVKKEKKCVISVAPHTTNWDFVIGFLGYLSLYGDHRPHFFMKKEWFVFPLGIFFRAIGGIPVDRSHHTSLTDQMADEIKRREVFRMAVTPEGTRSKVTEWKKGFYYIAKKAGVPIQLAYIDGKKKEIGITKTLIPSEDEAVDLKEISIFYKDVTAIKREKFAMPDNFQ